MNTVDILLLGAVVFVSMLCYPLYRAGLFSEAELRPDC